ncbi:hypothetical protein PR048_027844 [Dryococelus australis]|uniref:Uncharacterized protein n=1 Tax=Dryococelus australis TaxID=614101 RepID=A0ABQ9GHK4_9NEOP|nr:hypothetical protein PR048_027844 [Dryococelus australis]
MRADEGEARWVRSIAGMKRRGKRKIPEKTYRSAESSVQILMCENPGADRPLTAQPPWPPHERNHQVVSSLFSHIQASHGKVSTFESPLIWSNTFEVNFRARWNVHTVYVTYMTGGGRGVRGATVTVRRQRPRRGASGRLNGADDKPWPGASCVRRRRRPTTRASTRKRCSEVARSSLPPTSAHVGHYTPFTRQGRSEVSMKQRQKSGGGVIGRSPRKPAGQRHRPVRFPHAKIIELGSPRWEASSLTAKPPRPPLSNVAATKCCITLTITGRTEYSPMRVIAVSNEQRRDARAGEARDTRKNPPTSGRFIHEMIWE